MSEHYYYCVYTFYFVVQNEIRLLLSLYTIVAIKASIGVYGYNSSFICLSECYMIKTLAFFNTSTYMIDEFTAILKKIVVLKYTKSIYSISISIYFNPSWCKKSCYVIHTIQKAKLLINNPERFKTCILKRMINFYLT